MWGYDRPAPASRPTTGVFQLKRLLNQLPFGAEACSYDGFGDEEKSGEEKSGEGVFPAVNRETCRKNQHATLQSLALSDCHRDE